LRIGILGGTFDPIHFGHLRIAEETLEELELEKVLLIPGGLPPHKYEKEISPFDDRMAMTRLAVQNAPSLKVLDLEGRREGFSYSIETLRVIHEHVKADLELFFIIGIDAFMEITSWKDYKDLFHNTNFVVLNRPGVSFEDLGSFVFSLGVGFKELDGQNIFTIPSGNQLIFKKATLMDISSTKIRNMVAAGKSIRFLVPEAVRSYILEKGLYGVNGNA
jgi:nicotinate-nucleotide adenylyltransferase